MSKNNKEFEDVIYAIRDFRAELEYYHLYDQKDTEAIARLQDKLELEYIKYDELESRKEPIDSKMELYDEIGIPSSGIANGYRIVTEMCEDLLKQARKPND